MRLFNDIYVQQDAAKRFTNANYNTCISKSLQKSAWANASESQDNNVYLNHPLGHVSSAVFVS